MPRIRNCLRPRGAGSPIRTAVSAVAIVLALAAAATAMASSSTVIRSTDNANLGRILEGPARYTLYVFCAGTRTSDCVGSASKSFTPLIARGRVVAAAGSRIKASRLGTQRLRNGQHQVTYYGQPLFLYSGDRKPGQANGEERSTSRGAWYAVNISGAPVASSGY